MDFSLKKKPILTALYKNKNIEKVLPFFDTVFLSPDFFRTLFGPFSDVAGLATLLFFGYPHFLPEQLNGRGEKKEEGEIIQNYSHPPPCLPLYSFLVGN